MNRNIEIKFKPKNYDEVFYLARKKSDSDPEVFKQEDIFYGTKTGRLKLRKLSPTEGQLIHYDRPNEKGPKTSKFDIFKTKEPNLLHSILSKSNYIVGYVKKERTLLMIGNSRIHFDKVESLGYFAEIEVVLTDKQTEKEGRKIMDNLIEELNIDRNDLIKCSYIDLILNQ